jgi:DsbC/DsbD-like thiol-disulfide interchange protein
MRRRLRFGLLLACIALLPACNKPAASTPDAGAAPPTPQAKTPTEPLPVEEPSPEHPFRVQAVLRPAQARRGDTLELTLEGRTAAGWHIYAVDGPGGLGIATSLELKLPEGLAPAGDWHYPEPRPAPDGQGTVYEGRFQMRRPLRVTETAPPGPIAIQCVVRYQACDPFHCRPPETITLVARGEVVSSR